MALVAYTGLRYLQRKGVMPTRRTTGRFQIKQLKSHKTPVNLPKYPHNFGNDEIDHTTAWPSVINN